MTSELEWLVNVEIKSLAGTVHNEYVVQRVMDIIRATGMRERTLVSSFHHDYLRRARAHDPDIALGVLVENPVADPVKLVGEIGAQSYHPHTSAIERHEIRRLRESGLHVLVWVVNQKEDMRRYLDAGVRGLFTDFPQRLDQVLRECPKV
jgi:glycerophosphoryl diester phosphodiesterase